MCAVLASEGEHAKSSVVRSADTPRAQTCFTQELHIFVKKNEILDVVVG